MKILLAIAFCAASASAASMTTEDRDHLVAHLEMTETWLASELSGLSDAQLKFRPAPGKWTILDVVEHLTLSEPGYWDDLKGSMKGPPGKSKHRDAGDLYVLWYGIDRTNKQKTSQAEEPKGTLTDVKAGLKAIEKLHSEMLEYARTTDEDLRGHMYGYHDVYQWFIMISTHKQRHILQIREVKASPQFPKN
jgi:DinB superfamily